MSRHTRIIRLVVCGVAATTLLLGLFYACRPKPSAARARIAVTIGTPLVAPVVYADAEHLWKEDGLEVELQRLLLGRACLDAVLSGDADVATVAETPLVLSAAAGLELEILCAICSSDQHVHVAARSDHGVLTPRDLQGKLVATAVGTNNEYYLRQFLKHNGLDFGKIKLVNYNPAEMSRALLGGVIDGAAFWNPYLDDCRAKLGEKLIVFPPGDYYTVYYCLVARKGFAATNPTVADMLVRGLRRATDQMRALRVEAIPTIAAALPMQEDLLQLIWDGYRFEVGFPDGLTEEMLRQASWVGETNPHGAEQARKAIPSLNARVPELHKGQILQ